MVDNWFKPHGLRECSFPKLAPVRRADWDGRGLRDHWRLSPSPSQKPSRPSRQHSNPTCWGNPDLLRKELGGYIAGDIKSGAGEEAPDDDGNAKPKKHYAVQLALYSDILEQLGRSAGRRALSEELRTRVFPLGRDREFADSPLGGDGFELPVPRHKSRGFPQHSGYCGDIGGALKRS
jgi:hypothetical protein